MMTRTRKAQLLEMVTQSAFIFQSFGDSLHRIKDPLAICSDGKGGSIGHMRHAELMDLFHQGFVITPSEAWYRAHGGGEPNTDFYIPSPNLPSLTHSGS